MVLIGEYAAEGEPDVVIEVYGVAVAADTGGAIKGKRVDVYMEHKIDAREWGRRRVEVVMLR